MIALENKKGSVLIVDNNKKPNSILSEILREEGYWVESAFTFTNALEILRKKVIDVVLTDIEMPGKNGLEILYKIKKIKPAIQVVMITENPDIESYLDAMESGAFEYFNKSINNKILCKAIEKALITTH